MKGVHSATAALVLLLAVALVVSPALAQETSGTMQGKSEKGSMKEMRDMGAEMDMRDKGSMRRMDMMAPADGPIVPPVKGYAGGMEIRFIHTEASDTEIAKILTDMMGSPVLLVPSLARTPEGMLARVYVFTNGVEGDGPLNFQPDVFDHPPADPAYSPLRSVNLVTWKDDSTPRVLKSAAEVQEAVQKGELTIEEPGVVVNMPMLTWPGGRR